MHTIKFKRVSGPPPTEPSTVSPPPEVVLSKSGLPASLDKNPITSAILRLLSILHGLNSNVVYPSLSGTNTARDFVEFPSQFNENYLTTPEVLQSSDNRQRLIREEEDKAIDHRFTRALVKKLIGIDGIALDDFMKRYRPSYYFAMTASDYDFGEYIKLAYDDFRGR